MAAIAVDFDHEESKHVQASTHRHIDRENTQKASYAVHTFGSPLLDNS